ncbi:hypothetical protein OU789_10980 [Halocynthiibacter sp. C4]|uniref:hypothetical protein n=1 Tax=Halocynthiibacter sp. C4 TaxID=2992758 RepID=UPI00237AE4EF|nr:hypothetical protein [Halocynthiibacter sp. C4]MDE0590451.1 hypothetical protein [Halocynthiibacter sp. C4]
MKRIFALAALLATPAAAEIHPIATYKAWDVSYADVDSGEGCSMSSMNNSGHSLDFVVWDDESLQMYVFFNAEYDLWFDEIFDANFEIDRSEWTLYDAHWDQSSMAFTFPTIEADDTTEFFKDLVNGNAITLNDADGGKVTGWSLAGSRAAFKEMFECAAKLGGLKS